MRGQDVLIAALGLSQLDLDAVDTVHTVDEENQYEDEGNLSSRESLQAKAGMSVGLPSCHIEASL